MTINETLVLPPKRDERWELALHLGVDDAASRLPNTGSWRETDETRPGDFKP